MGAASSSSPKNTYYRKFVDEIVNSYPVITMFGEWKFWSGHTITLHVNGRHLAYPIDYIIKSTKGTDGSIEASMHALWPDNYPATAIHNHEPMYITDVSFQILPALNRINITSLFSAAMEYPREALPEEMAATETIQGESLCILLRMAQQAQRPNDQTIVYVEIDVSEVEVYQQVGFTAIPKRNNNIVTMSSTLDNMVHKCRIDHLFHSNGRRTENLPYKKHVASILEKLSNINTAGRWQFWSGRRIFVHEDNNTNDYPIDYELTIKHDKNSAGHIYGKRIKLNSLWPANYPMTKLQQVFSDYMTTVQIEIGAHHIHITYLENGASSMPSVATSDEKSALAGLISEGLCIMLRMIQESDHLSMNTLVLIEAGLVRIESANIDHIPHKTRKEREDALRRYKHVANESDDRQMYYIEVMAKTEAVEKIYKKMGFHTRWKPDTPKLIEMESTIGQLVSNCEYKIMEDSEYL